MAKSQTQSIVKTQKEDTRTQLLTSDTINEREEALYSCHKSTHEKEDQLNFYNRFCYV